MRATFKRLWLLIAQVIAVAAGLLIAWRAFGSEPATAPHAEVVSVREAAEAPGPSASLAATRLEAGFRAAAKKASASVVNVYSRKASPKRPGARWRPYGDAAEEAARDQSSLGSGVIVAAQG